MSDHPIYDALLAEQYTEQPWEVHWATFTPRPVDLFTYLLAGVVAVLVLAVLIAVVS